MTTPACSGECLRASDVGVDYVPGNPIAYPHPDCEAHGDPRRRPMKTVTLTLRFYVDDTTTPGEVAERLFDACVDAPLSFDIVDVDDSSSRI